MENNEVWTNEDQKNFEKEVNRNGRNYFLGGLVIVAGAIAVKKGYEKYKAKKEQAELERITRVVDAILKGNQTQQSENNSN